MEPSEIVRKKAISEARRMTRDDNNNTESYNDDVIIPVPPPSTPWGKAVTWIRKNLLLLLTISSVFMGLLLGTILRGSVQAMDEMDRDTTIMLVSLPGTVLMRILKMMIIPLIISSLITGLSQQDAATSGRMGSRALGYYFSTTVMASATGLILVLSIHPGSVDSAVPREEKAEEYVSTLDSVLDLLLNMFPDNLMAASFQQGKTTFSQIPKNFTNDSGTFVKNVWKRDADQKILGNTNVLGLIIFCICFGMVLSKLGQKARIVVEFFFELNEAVLMLINCAMWYSPIGIMCLVCGKIMSIASFMGLLTQLGLYMVTVLLGLFIHGYITIPAIYFLVTRRNPYVMIKGVLQAIITALGTSSSAATLPVTFRCLEQNLGIDPRVTRFVLPIGATVNMDGTAIYEAVAPIFICQMRGKELSIGQLIMTVVTAMLASIGAASIPSAGLVTMMIVLTTLDMPTDEVYVILAVDWILDRFRTSVNVLGDCFGTAIVAHLCRHELQVEDAKFDEEREHQITKLTRELSGLSHVQESREGTQTPGRRQSSLQQNYLLDNMTPAIAANREMVRSRSMCKYREEKAKRHGESGERLNKSGSGHNADWV